MTGYRLAVVGATGAVGQEFIRILEQRDFPTVSVRLLASARSAGRKLVASPGTLQASKEGRSVLRVREPHRRGVG